MNHDLIGVSKSTDGCECWLQVVRVGDLREQARVCDTPARVINQWEVASCFCSYPLSSINWKSFPDSSRTIQEWTTNPNRSEYQKIRFKKFFSPFFSLPLSQVHLCTTTSPTLANRTTGPFKDPERTSYRHFGALLLCIAVNGMSLKRFMDFVSKFPSRDIEPLLQRGFCLSVDAIQTVCFVKRCNKQWMVLNDNSYVIGYWWWSDLGVELFGGVKEELQTFRRLLTLHGPRNGRSMMIGWLVIRVQ